MSPDDRIRVQHMLDAALRFVAGRTRADLDCNELLVFGLVRAVEVVGEAASRVSPGGRLEFPDVPWSQIVGMRNRLVHAYFDVDLTILLDGVPRHLPRLALTSPRPYPDGQSWKPLMLPRARMGRQGPGRRCDRDRRSSGEPAGRS